MKSKSLEDALAELEAKKTQTAEYLVKHAPEIEAATAKRNALNAKLAALPQKERREVLNAAGLNHVSAAPPPIEPLRGSGYTRPSKALEPIDWEHWGLMRDGEVPLWQAVALSVNVNPDAVPMDKAGDDFNKRLRVALAHANTGNLPLMIHYPNQPVSPIMLSQFAAWAVKLNIPNMPAELVAIAATATTAPVVMPAQNTATPAPVVNEQAGSDAKPWLTHDSRDPDPEQPWYTPARYFARQLVVTDSTLLTKKLVLADKVSNSLHNVGIYKRGGKKQKHSADTVLKAFANVTFG